MTVNDIKGSLKISPEPVSSPTIIMSEDSKQAELIVQLNNNTNYTFELKKPLKDAAGNDTG